MREIALIGAEHGVTVTSSFMSSHHEVKPPPNFYEYTGVEPKANVAIENCVPAERDITGYTPRYCDFIGATQLFTDLATDLNGHGINVIDIDDPRLVHHVQQPIAESLTDLHYANYSGEGFLSHRQQRKRGFARSLMQFINSNLREDIMFSNLGTSNAEWAVMGQGHADILYCDEELQAKLGIQVVDYDRISPDLDLDYPPGYGQAVLSYMYKPNEREVANDARLRVIERELDRRRYNAYSIGRVLGRKQPEPAFLGRFFIGGWAAESLFELTITDRDGKTFQGVVKDVLGDAVVEGTIDDKSVNFVKSYDLATTAKGSYKPVYYEGVMDRDSGQFEGRK